MTDLNDGVKTEKRPLFVLDNDGKYEGEWKASSGENIRHGCGVQVWHDGSIYEGQW